MKKNDYFCKEGKAAQITSSAFIKKHHLGTASTVQKAVAVLLKTQVITSNRNVYEVYDKFLDMWMRREWE